MIDVTVHVHLASVDELKQSLAHLTAVAEEILQATVTDPVKLAESSERIRSVSEALKSAVRDFPTT